MGYLQCDHPTKGTILEAILHGDDTHKEWLMESLDLLWQGKPVLEPRGSNTSDALKEYISKLESILINYMVETFERCLCVTCPLCATVISNFTQEKDFKFLGCTNEHCKLYVAPPIPRLYFTDLPEDTKYIIIATLIKIKEKIELSKRVRLVRDDLEERLAMYSTYICGGDPEQFLEYDRFKDLENSKS